MKRLLGRGADRQRGELGASNAAGALREKRGSYKLLGGLAEVIRPAIGHSRCVRSALLSEIVRYEPCQLFCVVVWRGVKHAKATFREPLARMLLIARI